MQGNNIITTEKVLDIVKTTYSTPFNGYMAYSVNVKTGHYVARLKGDGGIETNILCNEEMEYKYEKFSTVGGAQPTTNMELFTLLEQML